MNLPDELTFIEKYLSWLHYEPSRAGLLRVGAWTFAFLIILNLVAPSVPAQLPMIGVMKDQGLTAMSSTASDPRWGRSDIKTMQAEDKTSIAWIAGSSIMVPPDGVFENGGEIIPYRFIPGQTNATLKEEHGIDSAVYLYLKLGRRILDTYTMALDAIERKPDTIVLIVNPFWEFNDWAIFFKPNLMNYGAQLWPKHGAWKETITLLSPGNILWAAVGTHFPLIESSHDYLKALRKEVRTRLGVDLKKLKKGKEKQRNAAEFDYNHPLSFWIPHRLYDGDITKLVNKNGHIRLASWQGESMALNKNDSESWSHKVFVKMLDALESSGIPTFIYLAPISPNIIGNKRASEGYTNVYKALKALKSDYEDENIKILLRVPLDVDASMDFEDYLHLRDEGKFPAFLAAEIASMLEER